MDVVIKDLNKESFLGSNSEDLLLLINDLQ